VLAQSGIYVPGDSFKFVPVDCIFTHYPADEDKTMDLGRLGEECRRFKDIFSAATKNSLLLLNETFSTTSFEEGYYIARDSVRAILAKGIRTIYNTHMHKLAMEIDKLNEGTKDAKAASLVVESEGGRRSFKVSVKKPEGRSYAEDIAVKYGVTYEQLLK
jgi:DNA mismatch repair ATPase MutS